MGKLNVEFGCLKMNLKEKESSNLKAAENVNWLPKVFDTYQPCHSHFLIYRECIVTILSFVLSSP